MRETAMYLLQSLTPMKSTSSPVLLQKISEQNTPLQGFVAQSTNILQILSTNHWGSRP